MKIGIAIPNCREGKVYAPGFTTPELLKNLATAAENAGFASLWANDLQTTFDEALAEGADHPNFFEAQTTLAYIASSTSRIQLLTSAITVSLRDPILLAKQAATLDVLSGGRVALGVGLGGKRTELERLRGRFNSSINRGQWLDESLEVIHAAFTQPKVDHEGKYFSIKGAEIFPKPVQTPLPLYITGASDEMIRRAAQYGSGWIHMHIEPQQLVERVAALKQACAIQGTDPDAIEVSLQFDVAVAPTTEQAQEVWASSRAQKLGAARRRTAESSFIVGSPADIAQRLRVYQEAGMQHVGLIVTAESHTHLLDQVELLRDGVLSEFGIAA